MVSLSELNEVFETNKAQLSAFLIRMTTNRQDVEDIIQDTYIKANQSLGSFRGDSGLKTWLFSIASNRAKDLLRSQKRWPEQVTDICKEASMKNPGFWQEMKSIQASSPQGAFEIKEHISFCFTCVSKSLPLEQQLCLLLKEIHHFKNGEIASIMDITEAMVKYHLHLGRSKMIEIFDKRCALINKEGACHQCTQLNGIFNPKQNAQEERMKIKMVKAAANKDKEALFDLRTKIVESLDPFLSEGAALQLRHLAHNHGVMEEYLKKE